MRVGRHGVKAGTVTASTDSAAFWSSFQTTCCFHGGSAYHHGGCLSWNSPHSLSRSLLGCCLANDQLDPTLYSSHDSSHDSSHCSAFWTHANNSGDPIANLIHSCKFSAYNYCANHPDLHLHLAHWCISCWLLPHASSRILTAHGHANANSAFASGSDANNDQWSCCYACQRFRGVPLHGDTHQHPRPTAFSCLCFRGGDSVLCDAAPNSYCCLTCGHWAPNGSNAVRWIRCCDRRLPSKSS